MVARKQAVAVMIIGDLNIHQARWLRYSNGNSAEGHALQEIASQHGLKQIVRKPTRYSNLLDLVITDIASKAKVGGRIRDHAFVIIETQFTVPRTREITRSGWNYSKADWDRLQDNLQDQD